MGSGSVHLSAKQQLECHHAEAFVIHCMDFRLVDDVVNFVDN